MAAFWCTKITVYTIELENPRPRVDSVLRSAAERCEASTRGRRLPLGLAPRLSGVLGRSHPGDVLQPRSIPADPKAFENRGSRPRLPAPRPAHPLPGWEEAAAYQHSPSKAMQ